jgi:O-antigen/teichoic acid export membrane protein
LSSSVDRLRADNDGPAVSDDRVSTVIGGARWLGLASVLAQAVTVISTICLGRLLDPSDFGVVALVSVVMVFVSRTFGDSGTTTALVAQQALSRSLASTTFWVNIGVGALCSAALWLVSTPLSSLLGDSSTASIIRWLALTPLLAAPSHVPRAMLRRRGHHRALSLVTVLNAVTTGSVSVVLAWRGWDGSALVAGTIVATVVSAVATVVSARFRPRLEFSRTEWSAISRFSRDFTGSNLFGFFTSYGDRLVVGRFLGVADLGFYGMANRLMRYPLQAIAQVNRDVAFPALAAMRDNPRRMADSYLRGLGMVSHVMFPLGVLIAVVAQPLVLATIGSEWAPAIPLVRLSAVTAALQSVAGTTGSLFTANGRADLSLRWSIVAAVGTMTGYLVGSLWGVVGVAWGFFIAIVVLSYPAFRWSLRLVGERPAVLVGVLWPPCLVAGLTAAAGGIALVAVQSVSESEWIRLALPTAIGGASGLLVTSIVAPATFKQLRRVAGLERRNR